MAAVTHIPRAAGVDLHPASVGVCEHCGQPLYEHAPIATAPLSHIACALYDLRHP